MLNSDWLFESHFRSVISPGRGCGQGLRRAKGAPGDFRVKGLRFPLGHMFGLETHYNGRAVKKGDRRPERSAPARRAALGDRARCRENGHATPKIP